MTVKATVCYDGTDFLGWQVQEGKRTVQGEIERALKELSGEDIRITGSGRTDAGVHAEGQVFSFKTTLKIDEKRLYKAINAYLPQDIRLLSTEKTDEDFNARYSAKRKTYEYRFYESETVNPLKERYALNVYDIDFSAMKECVKLFKGKHDFSAFCSTGSSVKTTERTVYSCSLKKSGESIVFSVTGNGFLYNMVRIMAGTLLCVGEGKIPKENVLKAFETGDRKLLGKTLSPKGLCLKKVVYGKEKK